MQSGTDSTACRKIRPWKRGCTGIWNTWSTVNAERKSRPDWKPRWTNRDSDIMMSPTGFIKTDRRRDQQEGRSVSIGAFLLKNKTERDRLSRYKRRRYGCLPDQVISWRLLWTPWSLLYVCMPRIPCHVFSPNEWVLESSSRKAAM